MPEGQQQWCRFRGRNTKVQLTLVSDKGRNVFLIFNVNVGPMDKANVLQFPQCASGCVVAVVVVVVVVVEAWRLELTLE